MLYTVNTLCFMYFEVYSNQYELWQSKYASQLFVKPYSFVVTAKTISVGV